MVKIAQFLKAVIISVLVACICILAYAYLYQLLPPDSTQVEDNVRYLQTVAVKNTGNKPAFYILDSGGQVGKGGYFSLLRSSSGEIYLSTKEGLFSDMAETISMLKEQGNGDAERLDFEKKWISDMEKEGKILHYHSHVKNK